MDLSTRHVGDVFDLPASEANLLIAEGWADLCALQPVARKETTARREVVQVGDNPVDTRARLREKVVAALDIDADTTGIQQNGRIADFHRDPDGS